MEVLSVEESQQIMASMVSPFIRHNPGSDNPSNLALATSGQNVLLVHGPGQEYKLTKDHNIPELKAEDEVLIRVIAIGLNPIDWKGPDYNFGLPSLPWINGRDCAGVVVKASKSSARVRVGDLVLSPSTDYRDVRKAAFQEYVISTGHNSARIPRNLPVQTCAALGVAFTAAALALGVCFGVNYASQPDAALRGPDLLHGLRKSQRSFPVDIRDECLEGIALPERANPGDWIAIWGAFTATGLVALQLAKFAGIRTIGVVDVSKHGERLLQAGVDLLVDRFDTDRAVSIIRGVTKENCRFGFDTVGKETAAILQSALSNNSEQKSHLVVLTGVPKTVAPDVIHHILPIKAFHTFTDVGESMMNWLERLLLNDKLVTPQVAIASGGLEGVNAALDALRKGTVAGKRIVVPVRQISATA